MEGDASATASTPAEMPETKNARSIFRKLFNRQRFSLSRWKHQTGERQRDISKEHFHQKASLPYRCSFCADARVQNWFRSGYCDETSDLNMDRIPNMLSRTDTCILCLIVSTIVAGRDDFDPDQDVLLKASANGGISVFVKGKSGKEEEIGILGSNINRSNLFWPLYEPEKLGLQPILTIDQSIPEKIDWPVVKKWIDDSPEKDDLDHYPTDFRLIDVEHLCVVRAQKACTYACLSYVWGKDTSYQATLELIDDLERPNSLGTWNNLGQRITIESSDVPATIKDAIVACSALGIRYLWVDRLCILQDEDEEKNPSKRKQISAMGDIYRCAFVTMVALEGASATHGLHGVSLNRVPHYQVRIGDGVLLDSLWSFTSRLNASTWNKRGWTYQEAILSPRLLYFTKHGLWYEHRQMECMKSDSQIWANLIADPPFHWQSSDKYGDGGLRYDSAVEMITEREFGYEWDILDGFSGVLKYFFRKDHRFGIPLDDFDYGLLWQPSQRECEKRQSRGAGFPSWSWVSVRSRCYYDTKLPNALVQVASWIFLDGGDIVRVPCLRTDSHTLEEIVLGSILWKCGCMIEPFPDSLHFKGKVEEYANLFRENWPTKKNFFEECHGIKPDRQQRYGLLQWFDEGQVAIGLKPGAVLGYSQTAVLTLGPAEYTLSKHFGLYHGGREIGYMDYHSCSDYSEAVEMFRTRPVEVEIFALLATSHFNSGRGLRGDTNIDFQNGTITAGPPIFGRLMCPSYGETVMHVMPIRTSNGISYRMGRGWVDLCEWLKLERTFKAIVLQ